MHAPRGFAMKFFNALVLMVSLFYLGAQHAVLASEDPILDPRLMPLPTEHTSLAETIKNHLGQSGLLAQNTVIIQTKGAMVQLTGWVAHPEDKDRIEAIARQTPGVERIINHLEYRPQAG